MSKVKKVLCFVLALAMVFALAVPALAANGGDEGIEPYGLKVQCPRCGASATSERIVTTQQLSVSSCPNYGHPHVHTMTTTYYAYDCSGCGYWESSKSYSTTCPYAQ